MIISILLARLTYLLLHIFGRGATTLPGRIALKIKPNILTHLSKEVRIICVTGTNGKTTTCALLEHALKCGGYSYFINKSGANMITGVATAFIMNSTMTGRCKKDFAILECDENSLPLITKYIDAEVIAVTNLFRDQLDRYGEINHTLNKIKEGITNSPSAVLVLNADCPLTYSLAQLCDNETFTFGINDDIKSSSIVSDNRYCPCGTTLRYKSRVYAQLGDFYCPHCGYTRVTPDFSASDISTSELGSSFIISDHCGASLSSTSLGGIYNIYNFITAAAVLGVMGIHCSDTLCGFSGAFGRMERFQNGRQTILLLLVKNPVGLSSCIKYVCSIKGELDIAFSLNDNDADGRDVSWIWDSDFTPISMKSPAVYTAGLRSLDMALRLKYDGIRTAKIIDGEDYRQLLGIIKESSRDFVIFSSYTSMMNMRKYFIDEFGGREFWQ